MKKLSLMIMLLMWFNVVAPIVHAADSDMDDLEALMWELDDGGTMDEDTGDTENTDEDMSNEQVSIDVNDTTTTSIKLVLHPIEGYTTYKVYFNKEGDTNIWEKEITDDTGSDIDVELTDLEPGTTYELIAKAFDDDGNPIESTASDSVTATTKEETEEPQHQAPADNVIYNPTVKTYEDKIVVTYKPGMDVKKVQISISDDGNVFKPVAVVDATTTTYTIPVEKSGKKYVKLVPVAEDGTLGVCKVWTTNVDFVTADIPAPKKEAPKHIGKPKTGPETYLLAILAVFAYVLYARRKMKA